MSRVRCLNFYIFSYKNKLFLRKYMCDTCDILGSFALAYTVFFTRLNSGVRTKIEKKGAAPAAPLCHRQVSVSAREHEGGHSPMLTSSTHPALLTPEDWLTGMDAAGHNCTHLQVWHNMV
jgi:hypothetical protein